MSAFSVFDALLWRDTPYGPHDRYVLLGEAPDAFSIAPMPRIRVDTYSSYQDAFDSGRTPVFEGLIPFDERNASLIVDGVATNEVVTWLLPDAYDLLRSRPILGRVPADPDGAQRVAREIAIGEQLWTRRFGRRGDVLGTPVTLNGETAVVVGVMPSSFRFHRSSSVWTAWSRPEILADPSDDILLAGRIAEGWRLDQVSTFTWPVWLASAGARTPPDTLSRSVLRKGLFGRDVVPGMLVNTILTMMALVLVAACLNLAMLYLARLRWHAPDYATHQALGAGPGGVLRQILVEIGLIIAAGGAAAAIASLWLVGLVRDRMSGVLMSWVDIRIDGRGFALTLAVLALALVIVAVPAIRLVRRLDLARLLTHKGVLGGAPKHGRSASALIAIQVAVVVVLTAASLPIATSALRLADFRSGIPDDRIAQLDVSLSSAAYATDSARDEYARRARAALAAHPQMTAASRVGQLVEWRSGPTSWSDTIHVDMNPDPLPRGRSFRLSELVVSEDYFAVTELELVTGQGFGTGLHGDGDRVAVLSAEAARRLWPGQPAVGRSFRRGSEGPWIRVVGVVSDRMAIWEDWEGTTAEPDPVIYLSDRQAVPGGMRFHVRARQTSPMFVSDASGVLELVDPSQPVAQARLLSDLYAIPLVQRKWIAVVLGSGAVAAVLLAMIGVVGLVSYYTTARLPELALRVALGAPSWRVVWLVARGTLRSVAIGVAIGALSLAIIQDGIRRFTYETSTQAPSTLALIGLAVLAVAMVALVVPLRRLRRLSPQELLRVE